MAKQSLLTDMHRANGAVFEQREGWLLPKHFGDPAAEYRATRSGAGLLDLSHRALLQLTGPDRFSYLQGMVSNDLRSLAPGNGMRAAFLNQQGKVLSDLRILCSENSFYLDFREFVKDKIIDHLNRYLVADEVEIADRSAAYSMLSIQGPHAESLLQKVTAGTVESLEGPGRHAIVDIGEAKACVVRESPGGQAAFDVIVPRSALEDFARKASAAAKQFAAAWVGEETQNVLRIESGIPRYGIDFSEDNLLLEVGLKDAVSFTKGCYLGQEIVERIRSRGHVNRKLVGFIFTGDAAIEPGARILSADKEIGSITSSVFSPALSHPIALGYVQRDSWNEGTKVKLDRNGIAVTGEIVPLPFVSGSQKQH